MKSMVGEVCCYALFLQFRLYFHQVRIPSLLSSCFLTIVKKCDNHHFYHIFLKIVALFSPQISLFAAPFPDCLGSFDTYFKSFNFFSAPINHFFIDALLWTIQVSCQHPLAISIRDTETVDRLRSRIKEAKRVLVIGNGGIATEIV